MQSRGLYGKKYLDIQVRERAVKLPDEDHVIVKVHSCGVCGTDINFLKDWEDGFMPLGHEISAEVIETGKNVKNVQPGDRVVVEDCTMCGICKDCKSGHPEFCRNMYDLEGQPGMGQYLSVGYNSLIKFEGLDYITACLTEPLAVSLISVINARIPIGGSVAVFGPGPLGLMSALLARFSGAGYVAVIGLSSDNAKSKARMALAEKWGSDLVLESKKHDIEREVKKKFPCGVDSVIVSSPPETLHDAIKIIRFGGTVTFFGLNFGGKNSIDLDINDLIFRKINLIPTFAEPALNFPAAVTMLKKGIIPAEDLVTHIFKFEDARQMMEAILDGSKPVIKAIMSP